MQGLITNLKLANGTPPSMIENSINSTIEKVKLHFEEIYLNNLPLDVRQVPSDSMQSFQKVLDMKQSKEP